MVRASQGSAETQDPRPLLALAVVGAVLLAYWPMLAGKIVFHRDSALWVFPARWFVRRSLLDGEFPSWNPYQGLGIPLLADPQYGLFYPPHWLFLLVPDGSVAHLASWLHLAHLAWGGVGMAFLARRLGGNPWGAAVGGLTWALSGPTTSAWSVGPLLLGQAWIPWVARGFLLLARGTGRAPFFSAVWPLALSLLVGEPFMSAMAMCFAALVVLAAGEGWRPTATTLRATARSALAWLLAVAVAAVAWLPALRMLDATERAQAFGRQAAEIYSHHPLRVLEMVAPGALGDPTGAYPAGRWVGETAAAGAPLFGSSYLGVVSVACAGLALRRTRLRLALVAAAGLAFLVALGKHAPVHDVWRRVLFPFAHMHSPEKYLALVAAPVSLLAGLGASGLFSDEAWRPRRLVALAGCFGLLAAGAGLLLPPELVADARTAALHGLALLALLCGPRLLSRRWPRVAGLALVALVGIDLGRPAHRLAGFGPASLLTRPPAAAAAVLADHGAALGPPRVFREPNLEENADPLRPQATWEDSQARAVRCLTPNTLNVYGLAVLPGYASAMPESLNRLLPRTYGDLGRSLRLLAMPYVLASDAGAREVQAAVAARALARPLPGGTLLRAESVLPRVYLPLQVRGLPPELAGRYLREEAVLSGREAVLLTAGSPTLTPRIEPAPDTGCRLLAFAPARLVAECSTPAPNLAVFVEQADPGWTATVDGQPARVLTANLVMRAVPVPAGTHRIELAYRTPGLRPAAVLSLLGLAVALGLWATARFAPGSRPWRYWARSRSRPQS